MKTMQAEYKTDIARLAEYVAKRDTEYKTDIARLAEDMAKRDTEAAKRHKENLRWQIGLWVAAIVVLSFVFHL